MAYKSLSPEDQKRFDPMITGFNPTDMYAADHIKRVLKTFPGVFSGIGEFTIHKEFVSSKVAGDVASLTDKALDRILDFAGEAGLLTIIHSDIHSPFPKPDAKPVFLDQMKAMFLRHPKTTIIWAHTGLGRIVDPVNKHAETIEKILKDPKFKHVYFDVSWSEVAKYLVSSPQALKLGSELLNKYPDRFLFGTDEVAPSDQKSYLRVYEQYAPLFALLKEETKNKLLKANYEKLFDDARVKVRKWENIHL
jgi:predicted TIM-barrel fold metal-dependent hydrolase